MTDEELLLSLRKLTTELGKPPTAIECNKCPYTANQSTYRTRFGSWNKAKELAGIEINNKFAEKSNKELIDSLVAFYKNNNRAPTQKECRHCNGLFGPNTYKDAFGGWEEALEAAGISKNILRTNQASSEELLQSLKTFYLENNCAPRHEDCNSGQFSYLKSHMVYTRRFGTFSNALLLAEIPLNPESQVSKIEKELLEEIRKFYSGKIVENDRTILEGKYEIDILLPDVNIGIEMNGIYWHSELFKDKNYHINKTIFAKSKNIRLIHIWESEWHSKRVIVLNRLKHILGNSGLPKVYARNCTIKEIDSSISKEFLDTTHIQGGINCSVKLGLYHNEELVAVQTYSKARFSKEYEWELVRHSSKVVVVGGASKLFKYFIKTRNPVSIVSYSDIRWNTGALYEQLGFILSHTSEPNYWYQKAGKLESRHKYQKHKLPDLLKTFDSNLTEAENMSLNGFSRVFDCGNLVYVYIS